MATSRTPKQSYVAIVDTETTGLPQDQDALPIAVAIIVLDEATHQKVFECDWLILPRVLSPHYQKAEAVHGIPYSRLEAEGASESASLEVLQAIDAKFSPKWTSFNWRFDSEMLRRIGFEAPRSHDCIMHMAAARCGKRSTFIRLSDAYLTLCERPMDKESAHRATYDTQCTYEVFCRCIPIDPF